MKKRNKNQKYERLQFANEKFLKITHNNALVSGGKQKRDGVLRVSRPSGQLRMKLFTNVGKSSRKKIHG